jgi:D-glycero-alpha-D-manno-heptose-7-phosphate kinase
LNALHSYRKKYVTLHDLAEAACHIEIDVLKNPIGKQDQYAAAFGGFNAYWFEKDGSVQVEPVQIPGDKLMDLQNSILLFYLNVERKASTVLDEQDKKCQAGDPATMERLLKIKAIGLETKKIFEKGDIH